MDIKLDTQQKKAVTYDKGNLLVIAGPGAGKTRVIIERMRHLINNGVEPDRILAITFTNKAADEIHDRIIASFTDLKIEPTVSTFHSFALKILRDFHDVMGMKKFFSVIDEEAQNEILKVELTKQLIKPTTNVLRRLRSHLDFEKANITNPISHPYIKGVDQDELVAVFRSYQQFLIENNAVDFNDLILFALMILQGEEDARSKYRNRYDHILLDEFQDINKAQYELIRFLARDDSTVLTVTDADQMIYAWRGSNPELIKNYLQDFNAEIIELTKNYRAKDELISAAKSLISHNKPIDERRIKLPEKPEFRIALFLADQEDHEAGAIAKIINTNISRGAKYGDICIIYRMHGFGDIIEQELNTRNIPLTRVRPNDDTIRDGTNQLMSYLKLSQNLFDWDVRSAWDFPRRILNPLEGYRITSLSREKNISLYKLIRNPQYDLNLSALAINRLRRFANLVENMSILGDELTPSGYFQKLKKALSGYLSPFNPSEENLLLYHLQGSKSDLDSLAEKLLDKDSRPHVLFLHTGGTQMQLCALMFAGALREYLGITSHIAVAHSISDLTWERLERKISPETPLVIVHLGESKQSDLFLSEFWTRGFAFDLFEIKPRFKGESFLTCLATFRFLIDLLTKIPKTPDERLVFYDLETTGIDTYRCEIIEISALATKLNSSEKETYNNLVKPASMPPPEVQELTGITPDMLVDAPPAYKVIPEFDAFSRDAVIIGHNIERFDNPIMQRYFNQYLKRDFMPDCIDTVLWARELFPGMNNSLSALGERFGLSIDNLHRATEDVRLNCDVFYKLLETDNLKRGLDFSKTAIVLMALMTLEREEPESGAGRAFINASIRILANDEINIESLEKILDKAFSQSVRDELLSELNLLKKEPYPDDPERDKWESIAEFLGSLILHFEERNPSENISGFVSYYSLLKESDLIQSGDTVKMMTIHSAKGLEFPIAIIAGLEQGSIPHYLALENRDRIEEERRLFYVAMTRAMDKVYLTYCRKRGGKHRSESMFLKEMPSKLIKRYDILS